MAPTHNKNSSIVPELNRVYGVMLSNDNLMCYLLLFAICTRVKPSMAPVAPEPQNHQKSLSVFGSSFRN